MQEKELKEQLELYNDKSKIKSDLVGKLMDVSEGFQIHWALKSLSTQSLVKELGYLMLGYLIRNSCGFSRQWSFSFLSDLTGLGFGEQIVTESERLRMQKLEELNKVLEAMDRSKLST